MTIPLFCLCKCLIFSPLPFADRPGLRNIDLVTKMQTKMVDILKKSVSANHPENPNIFEHVMKKIPDLRTLNTLHSEKLLAYRMEPHVDGQTVVNAIEGHIQVTSMATPNTYSPIPPEYWSKYNHLISPHPPCLAPEEDPRSTSPGQHSQHSGSSSTGSEWSTTDSTKDEHDLVGSPRSIGSSGHDLVGSPRSIGSSGLCIDDVKSPIRSASFSSSRSYVNEEAWPTDLNQSVVEYHHSLPKRVVENPGSEHGSSSGDEGYFIDSPSKGPIYPKLRRVDSPTDSGIESGKEHGPSTTPTISLCSSPQSSVDEKVKDVMEHDQHKHRETIEDMPVLKRALQAPPIINPHMLMDEAYRHHKKFRAARREAESPASPSSQQHMSLASTHSTLVRTLEQAPRYLSEQQLKRTDLIHNIIMQKETQNQQPIQQQQQTLSQSHHETNNHYVFSSAPHQNSNNNSHTYTVAAGTQQHKNLLVCQNGQYYNAQYAPASASWPFAQRQSPSPQSQYEHQQNSCPHPQGQQNFSRSASPQRLVYTTSRSPTTSPLVMNGDHHRKPSGEASQPLNLSKKLFTPPPMLKMES